MGSASYKTKFGILGVILVPCFGRLALHGTGSEHELYRYLIPFFVGGLAGYIIGFMKDKWLVINNDLRTTNEVLKQEIDEHKQAEDALRESEERYRTLVANLPVAVYRNTPGPKGAFLMANPAFCKMFGFKNEEEVKDFTPAGLYQDPKKRKEYSDNLIEKGLIKNDERTLLKKDGTPVYTSITSRVVYGKDGEVSCFDSIMLDITEQKNLEAQLQQALKMEAIGTLAGGIAHDFNNILGIILGNTELAMDDVPEWNPASQNLDEVKKACLRAKDVVKQILSFSHKSEVDRKPLNIASVITESLKLLRASIPTSIDIHQNIPGDICDILGDPTQIHQIMINLCTNAAHAMENDAGTLEVTVENITIDKDTACQYHELHSGPYVQLVVSDTGDGISPEVKDRVFDPYFTTKDVGKGTGLGLSVVHGIVNSHHGRISVESKTRKGTTFKILFPAIEEKSKDKPKEFQELPIGDERILFVDDEESMVKLNQQRLEKLGYRVIGKTDPSEALEFFRTNPDQIDLIITDMTMPKMTGDKLVQAILEIRPNIPIILCTGYSEKISKENAQELGIRKYIEKPIEMEVLARSAREVLDG
jgi:PAS domain S-box-containing protein